MNLQTDNKTPDQLKDNFVMCKQNPSVTLEAI